MLAAMSVLACACNDDLFIDRDVMNVEVDNAELPYTGGRSTVRFNPELSGKPISLTVRLAGSDYDHYYSGTLSVADDLCKVDVSYDATTGVATVDVGHSFYPDSVYLVLSRDTDIATQSQTVTILPAPPATFAGISYVPDSYFSYGNRATKLTYHITNTDETERRIRLDGSVPYMARFIPSGNLPSPFGADIPQVPVALCKDYEVRPIDAKIPYIGNMAQVPGLFASVPEEYAEVTVPPRTLGIIYLEYEIIGVGYIYTLSATTPGIDVAYTQEGILRVEEPEFRSCIASFYDLETGEEVKP